MIDFLIGLFIGGFIGVCTMCIVNYASNADDDIEQIGRVDKKCPKCGFPIPPWANGDCPNCNENKGDE